MATAPPILAPPVPPRSLDEFPDFFAPMLVKELRQAMRQRSFQLLFLVIHGIFAMLLISFGSMDRSDIGFSMSKLIFITAGVVGLVVQPFRGISAVASEVKNQTMEMMVLTRLSASRIVVGKWSALMSQTALILITVMPYLIFRYFLGGMDLVGELVLAFGILLASAALSALTVALSAASSVIMRVLIPAVGIPFVGIGVLQVFGNDYAMSEIIEQCSLNTPLKAWLFAGFGACALYQIFYSLSLGTSMIAAPAENHSLLRRLVPLTLVAGLVIAIPFQSADPVPWVLIAMAAGVGATAILAALSEAEAYVPTLFAPFRRLGPLGGPVALFFTGGWPSGVFFAILICGLLLGGISMLPEELTVEQWLLTVALMGGFLLAFVFTVLKPRTTSERVGLNVLVLIALGAMAGLATAAVESGTMAWLGWATMWNPVVLIGVNEGSWRSEAVFPDTFSLFNIAGIELVLIFSVLLLWALPRLRLMLAIGKRGQQ